MQYIISFCRLPLLRRWSLLFWAAAAAVLLMAPSSASSAEVRPWRCHLFVEYQTSDLKGDNHAYRLVPRSQQSNTNYDPRPPAQSSDKIYWTKEGQEWGDPVIWWFEDSWHFGYLPHLLNGYEKLQGCGYVLGKVKPPSGVTFTGDETCFEDDSVIEPEVEPYWIHTDGPQTCPKWIEQNDVDFDVAPMSAPGRILHIHTTYGITCNPVPRRIDAADKNNGLTLMATDPKSLRDCVDYAANHADSDLITTVRWDYKTNQCTAIKNERYDECTPSTSDGSGVISCFRTCTEVEGYPYDSQNRSLDIHGSIGEDLHLNAEGASDEEIHMDLVSYDVDSFCQCENAVNELFPNAKASVMRSRKCYALPDVVGAVTVYNSDVHFCVRPRFLSTPTSCPSPTPTTTTTPPIVVSGRSGEEDDTNIVLIVAGTAVGLVALAAIAGGVYWAMGSTTTTEIDEDEHEGDDLRTLEQQPHDDYLPDDTERRVEEMCAEASDMASISLPID